MASKKNDNGKADAIESATTPSDRGERRVIVRTKGPAGVHYGTLIDYVDHGEVATVTLVQSRRLWHWRIEQPGSTGSISDLAVHGPGAGSRIAPTVPRVVVQGACEVVDCTREAADAIDGWGR
ncbi:MAG TPA: hypothetical protein VJP45_10385 [Candidatus Limnocylindria bacterium]|nr:hypothetical protein [Candidatus Limnocylindria bacterium]